MLKSGDFNFSFSGIKTSVLYKLREIGHPDQKTLSDLCASFQTAVIQILTTKLINAAKEHKVPRIALSGGVACNTALRDLVKKEVEAARNTFKKYKWPSIDVTRKSVEETAASIIKIYEIFKENA